MKKLFLMFIISVVSLFALNFQTASKDELMQIKGIGEKKAAAIIKYRKKHKIKSADDLKNVPGIGKEIVNNAKKGIKNKSPKSVKKKANKTTKQKDSKKTKQKVKKADKNSKKSTKTKVKKKTAQKTKKEKQKVKN